MLRTLEQNTSGFQQFLYAFSLDFLKLQYPARNDPDKLCHILSSAPGIATITEKCLTTNATLNPEFCMPTSMLRYGTYDHHIQGTLEIRSRLRVHSGYAAAQHR
jgi:hypothetical protein